LAPRLAHRQAAVAELLGQHGGFPHLAPRHARHVHDHEAHVTHRSLLGEALEAAALVRRRVYQRAVARLTCPESRVRVLADTTTGRRFAGRIHVPTLNRDVRRLPLRGADLVLLARHPRWKGGGRAHNTMLVVECDGPIAPERITRAWDRFLDVCPWPAARLRRPVPWGKLHWAAGSRETLTRPPLRRATITTRDQLPRELANELNLSIEPRREAPLRVLLVDDESAGAGARSVLVLTWFHPLMDARGGENLLTHLNHLDGHEGTMPWGQSPPAFVPDRSARSLGQPGRTAGASLKYLRTLATVPPV